MDTEPAPYGGLFSQHAGRPTVPDDVTLCKNARADFSRGQEGAAFLQSPAFALPHGSGVRCLRYVLTYPGVPSVRFSTPSLLPYDIASAGSVRKSASSQEDLRSLRRSS